MSQGSETSCQVNSAPRFLLPMVLGPKGPGRVGRRQARERALPLIGGALLFEQ